MQVKNKKGEIEAMGYDAAQAAVTAGTHSFVNLEEKDGELVAKPDKAKEPHPPEPGSAVAGEVTGTEATRPVPDAPRKAR